LKTRRPEEGRLWERRPGTPISGLAILLRPLTKKICEARIGS
jgi:hypothetical protein